MAFEIQKNFFCENCKMCGARPIIEQVKKVWTVRCKNAGCKNLVIDSFINVEKWNSLNMIVEVGQIKPDNLKHTG
jgi:hypothetical protein